MMEQGSSGCAHHLAVPVMVGVVADDPHEDYQRQACFHHSAEGATAITASGLLLLDTTQAPACPASDPPGHKQQQQLAAQPPADASHPGQQPKQPCHPPASQPQLHTCYILAPASLLTPFLILDPPTCMQTHTESALTRCHLSDDATAFVTLSSSYVLGLLSRMHGGSSCSTCSCGSIHPTPAGGCNESHNALSSAAAAPPPVAYCPPYQPSLHHATQLLTLPATLVGLVTPPACADALSSALQDVRAGSGRGWRYGWGCGSSGSSGAPGMSVAGPSAWGRWGGSTTSTPPWHCCSCSCPSRSHSGSSPSNGAGHTAMLLPLRPAAVSKSSHRQQ